MFAVDVSAIGIYVSKAVASLLLPSGLALVLMATAWMQSIRARNASSRRFLAAAITVIALSSNPIFANFAISTVERLYPPVDIDQLPSVDVAVVLGGGVREFKPPRRVIELDSAGNRVLYAARLYRAGKVGKIIATGGDLTDTGEPMVEADLMRSLLVEWGVPETAIIVERKSRTTHENAMFTHDLWKTNGFKTGLLVTSASHMPRAIGAFHRAGMSLIPASVDVHAAGSLFGAAYDLIPSGEAVRVTEYAMREWIGRIGYVVLHGTH